MIKLKILYLKIKINKLNNPSFISHEKIAQNENHNNINSNNKQNSDNKKDINDNINNNIINVENTENKHEENQNSNNENNNNINNIKNINPKLPIPKMFPMNNQLKYQSLNKLGQNIQPFLGFNQLDEPNPILDDDNTDLNTIITFALMENTT